MQMQAQKELNCVGERCPAPILKVAKAARTLGAEGGGVLDVSADDPAFVMDLKSWCTSSKAELLELVDEGGVHRARVRVGAKSDKPAAVLPVSSPAAEAVEELDYRGLQCPAPILQLSKKARQMPGGQRLDVLSDDPAFELDVKSWCRSASAELIEVTSEGKVHRAKIRLAGQKPAAVPVAANDALAAASRATVPNLAVVAQGNVHDVDLRGVDPTKWRERLNEAHRRAAAGDRLVVMSESPAMSQSVMAWCSETNNAFLKFDASGPVTAEVQITSPVPEVTALAVPAADNRCTMLVLHNDHEALLAALLVAVGAASQGKDVTIFFTFWGLNLLRGDSPNTAEKEEKTSFMQKMMKWMMPKGPKKQKLGQMNFGGAGKAMLGHIMRSQNLMELPALLETAEEQGVRFIACTMSMEVMGITKRDLAPRKNLEFGGVAAFVEAAHGSGMSLVF
jgi:TusA-related sulfurtransferase/peroxiredoxin family protein